MSDAAERPLALRRRRRAPAPAAPPAPAPRAPLAPALARPRDPLPQPLRARAGGARGWGGRAAGLSAGPWPSRAGPSAAAGPGECGAGGEGSGRSARPPSGGADRPCGHGLWGASWGRRRRALGGGLGVPAPQGRPGVGGGRARGDWRREAGGPLEAAAERGEPAGKLRGVFVGQLGETPPAERGGVRKVAAFTSELGGSRAGAAGRVGPGRTGTRDGHPGAGCAHVAMPMLVFVAYGYFSTARFKKKKKVT